MYTNVVAELYSFCIALISSKLKKAHMKFPSQNLKQWLFVDAVGEETSEFTWECIAFQLVLTEDLKSLLQT